MKEYIKNYYCEKYGVNIEKGTSVDFDGSLFGIVKELYRDESGRIQVTIVQPEGRERGRDLEYDLENNNIRPYPKG